MPKTSSEVKALLREAQQLPELPPPEPVLGGERGLNSCLKRPSYFLPPNQGLGSRLWGKMVNRRLNGEAKSASAHSLS